MTRDEMLGELDGVRIALKSDCVTAETLRKVNVVRDALYTQSIFAPSAVPADDAAGELERLRGEVLARDQWARDVSMYYEMPYEGPDLFAAIAIFLRRQRALLAEAQHAAK